MLILSRIAACVIAPMLACGSLLLAAEPSPRIAAVEIGFNGLYKVGTWTPLVVELETGASQEGLALDVWTEDSDGAPARYTRPLPPVTGNDDGPRREMLVIKPGRSEGSLRVVLRANDVVLAERRFERGPGEYLPAPLARGHHLIVSLGESAALRRTLEEQPELRAIGTHLAELDALEQVPTDWSGYDGVDFVFMYGGGELSQQVLADARRAAALERWLRQGGRVVFSVGPEAQMLFADEASIPPGLALLAPGRFDRLIELRAAAALESFAGVSEPLLARDGRRRTLLEVPRFAGVEGEIVAFEGVEPEDLPLVVRQVRSFGQLKFIAIDLNDPALSAWSGVAPLITRLMFPDIGTLQSAEARSAGRVSHLGYDDLAGQLRAALGQFAEQGVRFLPFGVFAGLLVVYLLLIGPGDYLFVKRLLPRMEYTWLSFGAIVLAVCLGSVWLARWAKGDEWRRNKVDVVDVDLATGFARGRTWTTLFSPRSARFDLALAAEASSRPQLAWLGLPGGGLGGMGSTAAPPLYAEGYSFAPDAPRLVDVPLPIWSTKSFTGTWFPEQDFGCRAALQRTLVGLDDAVVGTIANESSHDWHDAMLIFDRWVIPLGDIRSGGRREITEQTPSIMADRHFTRRQRVGDTDVIATYDKASLDMDRVLEMLLFHQAAGGAEYTQLQHDYEGRLDFSRLMSTRRAILVVKTKRPAVEIEQTGFELEPDQTRQWTVYRFVIPVGE